MWNKAKTNSSVFFNYVIIGSKGQGKTTWAGYLAKKLGLKLKVFNPNLDGTWYNLPKIKGVDILKNLNLDCQMTIESSVISEYKGKKITSFSNRHYISIPLNEIYFPPAPEKLWQTIFYDDASTILGFSPHASEITLNLVSCARQRCVNNIMLFHSFYNCPAWVFGHSNIDFFVIFPSFGGSVGSVLGKVPKELFLVQKVVNQINKNGYKYIYAVYDIQKGNVDFCRFNPKEQSEFVFFEEEVQEMLRG